MNSHLLQVEAVGLFTQPITFSRIGTIAMKRFRTVDGSGMVGDEFDAIMIYPRPSQNSANHVVSFSDAAAEVAIDPFYMELSKELRTVQGVEMRAVRQFDRDPKDPPYNYYILTGNMLAAVQCIELLTHEPDVLNELRNIAKVAVDTRDKLIRFPWRPECVANDMFPAQALQH